MIKDYIIHIVKSINGVLSLAAYVLVNSVISPVYADDGHEVLHVLPHEAAGLSIDGGLTWFLQATNGAEDDTSALSYTLDLAFERVLENHGKLVVVFEAGDGEGADPVIGTLSGVNYDAFFTELTNDVSGSTNVVALSISQAYYENEYLAGALVMKLGKLDIHRFFDENVYANDETDQFMSAIFTRSADTSYKQLDFYYAPGLVAKYRISDDVETTWLVANGNRSGFSEVFENLYLAAQVNFLAEPDGHPGHYRFYILMDHRDTPETSFSRINSGKKVSNTAWGLSFDQALSGGIGLFARYSRQDDGLLENLVASSWSFGAAIEGKRWGKIHDTVGVAYGVVNINDNPAVITAAKISDADDERHFEVYYKFGYSHFFTLTTDLQVIENIGGEADADTVIVYGVRGQLNF